LINSLCSPYQDSEVNDKDLSQADIRKMNRLPELKLNQTVQKVFTVLTIQLKMPVSDSQRMELFFFFSFLPPSLLPLPSFLPAFLPLSLPPSFLLPLFSFLFYLMKEHDSKTANCLFVYMTCIDKRKHAEIFFLDSSLQSGSIDLLVRNYNL